MSAVAALFLTGAAPIVRRIPESTAFTFSSQMAASRRPSVDARRHPWPAAPSIPAGGKCQGCLVAALRAGVRRLTPLQARDRQLMKSPANPFLAGASIMLFSEMLRDRQDRALSGSRCTAWLCPPTRKIRCAPLVISGRCATLMRVMLRHLRLSLMHFSLSTSR
jgi:hypothetical protein